MHYALNDGMHVDEDQSFLISCSMMLILMVTLHLSLLDATTA